MEVTSSVETHWNCTVNSSTLYWNNVSYNNNSGATSLYEESWGWWLLQLGTPTLLLVGVTGNVLSLLVLKSPRFASKSYAHYLSALAVFDSLVLVDKYLRRLDSLLVATGSPGLLHYYGSAACKLHNFSEHVCYLMSSWLVLFVTLERFVAVVFPFRKDQLCRPRSALVATIVLFAVMSYTQIFRLIIIENVDGACTSPDRFLHVFVAMHIYMYQLVLQFMLPAVLILVCNLIILYKIRQRYRGQQQTAMDGAVRAHRAAAGNHNKTTVTLLVLSFTYLITMLPLVLLSIIIHVSVTTAPASALYMLKSLNDLRHLLEFISEFNYAVNFYIYVMSGAQFRLQLTRICSHKHPPSNRSYEMRHIRFTQPSMMNRLL